MKRSSSSTYCSWSAFSSGRPIAASDILPGAPAAPAPQGLRDERAEFEKRRVESVLKEAGGNRTEAAKVLGISRRMPQKKLKDFGVS